MGVTGKWSDELGSWIRTFQALPERLVEDPAAGTWTEAAQFMHDEAESVVHVTGIDHSAKMPFYNLKSSLQPPRVVNRRAGIIEVQIAFLQPYATYEFDRGGDHDALTRAYVATQDKFQEALTIMFDEAMRAA